MESKLLARKEEIYSKLLEQGLGQKYSFPGIYSISIDEKLVYIGKSKNMLERIASHILAMETDYKSNKYKVLRQAQQEGHKINFDVLYYSLLLEDQTEQDIGEKEGEYIRQYLPPLNYQIPKKEDYRKYEVNKSAKYITLEQIFV